MRQKDNELILITDRACSYLLDVANIRNYFTLSRFLYLNGAMGIENHWWPDTEPTEISRNLSVDLSVVWGQALREACKCHFCQTK